MPLDSLLSAISSLIIFACLLLATFLFAVKSENRRANSYFALFLILTAIDASGWPIATAGLSNSWWNALRFASVFLQMPLFVWFVRATCFTDFHHSKWDALHAMPFLLAVFLTLPGENFALRSAAQSIGGPFLTHRETLFLVSAAHIQYYAYIAITLGTLLDFRRIFREHCPDVKSGVFGWLLQLVAVSLVVHSLVLVKSVSAFTAFQGVFVALQIAGALAALAVITWFSLKALLQPELFRAVDKGLIRARRFAGGASLDAQNDIDKLYAHMDKAEPYLDPSLTVSGLAAQIGSTPRELSELINQTLGMSFFDFVNGYRIDRAKKMLASEEMTVLEILYAVGFNSKSSFNTAFRKHANMTPTGYRQSLQLPEAGAP